MKVIHTSDWHLGHQLYNWDRTDEHQLFFDELVKVIESENPDALVVCGDIYHTIAPSASTQKLYIDNMLRIHAAAPDMTIVITAGMEQILLIPLMRILVQKVLTNSRLLNASICLQNVLTEITKSSLTTLNIN